MQGQKQYTDKVITHFRLSERVPKHNLYRRLDELLDWSFLYHETQHLYSHTGQPSLDPVVFFKLLLVGRLENILSDRRLIEHCALRLDILLFLGYEVDEDLPWHSTVSRTRQLYPPELFEQLFDRVFALCVAQGLVAGDTQAVDSAPVKANASLDRLQKKQAPTAPAHQLRSEAARQARRQAAPGALGGNHPKARVVSNKTHFSPTDPDARISVKPGKARALNYLAWPWTRPAASSATYRRTSPTAGTVCTCPAWWRGCNPACKRRGCAGNICWPTRATPTAPTTPCWNSAA